MKILVAASEVAPIIKVGGLGDVVGSLPKALSALGVHVDVIVPFFSNAKIDGFKLYKTMDLAVPFDGSTHTVKVIKTQLHNSAVNVYLLQCHEYFDVHSQRKATETEIFSFFSRAVVEYIKGGFNTYDLIHCNDWHTGLVTHFLEEELGESRPATLFTIHNLMYQGIANADFIKKIGITPGEHPLIDWDVSDGDINLLQQGITSSDYVNTVSESYAREILTPEYGGGMHDILLAREGRLSGILNGLDYSFFPREDAFNMYMYVKSQDKKAFIAKNFPSLSPDTPLYCFIGRLDRFQKGLDMLYSAAKKIVEKNACVYVLGTGDKEYEKLFTEMTGSDLLVGRFVYNPTFDVDLARQLYSASDFILVPSRYEPCGLIQMIAMRYACLPIAHSVGGLKDSITSGENGFLFSPYHLDDFMGAIYQSMSVYENESQLMKMREKAFLCNFSWNISARKYLDLYNKVLSLHNRV